MKKTIEEIRKLRSFEEQLDGFREFFKMSTVEDPYDLWEPVLRFDKLGDCLWHCELFPNNRIRPLFHGEDESLKEAVKKCYESAKEFYDKESIHRKE